MTREPARPIGSERKSKAILKAVLWALTGALATLFLVVDPLDLHDLDGTIRRLTDGEGGSIRQAQEETRLWTCGMHPEVLSDEPGICPICHMDLVPVDAHTTGDEAADAAIWTCPMHSEVLADEPGACPICHMDLVPLEAPPEPGADAAEAHETHRQGTTVALAPSVVQRMNVTSQLVERQDLARRIRTVGTLSYDQDRMISVTTRYSGFVEKVYVGSVGQPVRKGDPLLEVYSPELVQTQQELLAALDYARRMAGASDDARQRADALVEAARQRLSWWEITPEQIAAIEEKGEVLRTLTVVSPSNGVIMRRAHGLEGMAITPGMDAIHVADISTLWLAVEVFEDQLPWVGVGSEADISLDYLPGVSLTGKVHYVEPEVSPTTRSVKLILKVPNRAGKLRVGMYATVVFAPVVARNALVVPEQAVIRTGERNIVVVALGGGRFAPREVTLGPASGGIVQVLSGIEDGEEIVTSAQFLIDSESNLRAAVQKMVAARQGHRH